MFNGLERGNAENLRGHQATGAQDWRRPPDFNCDIQLTTLGLEAPTKGENTAYLCFL